MATARSCRIRRSVVIVLLSLLLAAYAGTFRFLWKRSFSLDFIPKQQRQQTKTATNRDNNHNHLSAAGILRRPQKRQNTSNKIYWPTSLIYDKTLYWDPTVYRPWLDPNLAKDQQPLAMILLTSYGWNQPNQLQGLTFPRHRRETDFLTAVVNHQWFHPTLWNQIEQKTTDSASKNLLLRPYIRYYVFLDIHAYRDANYPIYGGGMVNNADSRFGRKNTEGWAIDPPYFDKNLPLFTSFLFQQQLLGRINATAVVFNAQGSGPDGPRNRTRGGELDGLPLCIGSLSALIRNVDPVLDQGLPPPALKPAHLSAQQVRDIETCEAETKRSLYFVYSGTFRSGSGMRFQKKFGGARMKYKTLHDDKRFFFVRYLQESAVLQNMTYQQVNTRSIFSLAARGDNKYSYRFSEVLSAGSIPVVHADDWQWPFRPEVVNWTACAVILPENTPANTTVEYLDSLSVSERCKMRHECYHIYKTYMETAKGTIHGMLEGLEKVAMAGGKALPLQGVRCDSFKRKSECNFK